MVLVLIPQMLFSEMVLSHEHASKLIRWAEDFTFLSWTFQGMKGLTKSAWAYLDLFQAALMILLLSALLLGGCLFLLHLRTGRAQA